MHRLCVYPPIFTVFPTDYFPYYLPRRTYASLLPSFLISLSFLPRRYVGISGAPSLRDDCIWTLVVVVVCTRNSILLVPVPEIFTSVRSHPLFLFLLCRESSGASQAVATSQVLLNLAYSQWEFSAMSSSSTEGVLNLT